MTKPKRAKPQGPKCGKKNRQGKPCALAAGWGTAHKGEGACKLHGGATPIKHGLYSKYSGRLVADRVKELVEDPDLLDMRRPIAIIEALTEKLLADAEAANLINGETREELLKLAKEQARVIERHRRVTEGTKHLIRVENVHVFINQVAVIVNEEVSDAATRARIAERLGGIRVLTN